MSSSIKFVPKGWGHEKWIVNNEKYCGKLLFFEKGKRCSWHYHKRKEETFYIHSGKIYLTMVLKMILQMQHIIKPWDPFRIPREWTSNDLEDSELYEFSTTHFESDSYRVKKGD